MSNEPVAERREGDADITMEVLHAVSDDARISQRALSARLNIALGLTNAYLKRCVRRGWVKVQRIPPNRYAYYLTPKGFSEKTRLTANYFYSSFRFYRRARNQCDALLGEAADNGWRRIAILGSGDLAEIAMLCALQHDVEIAGVVDASARANRFRHMPLSRDLAAFAPLDAVLVCDLSEPQQAYGTALAMFEPRRVLTPQILKVRTTPSPVTTPSGGGPA